MRRIVDLSMPVHPDMMTFPRVPPPMLLVNETHEEFAERIGTKAHGVEMGTAHYVVIQDDHVGTHCDAVTRWSWIVWSASSGSKRGRITTDEPLRIRFVLHASGAAW